MVVVTVATTSIYSHSRYSPELYSHLASKLLLSTVSSIDYVDYIDFNYSTVSFFLLPFISLNLTTSRRLLIVSRSLHLESLCAVLIAKHQVPQPRVIKLARQPHSLSK